MAGSPAEPGRHITYALSRRKLNHPVRRAAANTVSVKSHVHISDVQLLPSRTWERGSSTIPSGRGC
jgi:hypothetical protein